MSGSYERVFLTGGTGFLGGRTAQALAAAGCEVVMLARRPDTVVDLPAGTRVVPGDLLDGESLRRGMKGCDAVVHLAALVKRWARKASLFDQVNVGGLASVLQSAREEGISRVVYSSSFIALGPTDGTVGDEDHVHDGMPRNDYERTKCLADTLARRHQEEGDDLVVVYPGIVYGPGNLTDGNILAQVARDLLRRRLPGTIGPGDRRQCLAFVDDVAEGIRLALENAAPGSRYLLGGENITTKEALAIMAEAGGVDAPRRVIPYSVASVIGRCLRLFADLSGIEPKLTDEEVEIYRCEWAYTSERACRDLGYRITPAREGIRRMIEWLSTLDGREAIRE